MATYLKGTPGSVQQDRIGNYQEWATALQALQASANQARIPDAAALEEASSAAIASLLNPGTMFPDIARQAAETGTARGVSGSPAEYGTMLRMTDEERLRRMALGQDFLTAALGRNPTATLPDVSSFTMSPYQAGSLALQQQQLNLARSQARAQARASADRPFSINQGMPSLGAAAQDDDFPITGSTPPGTYPQPFVASGGGMGWDDASIRPYITGLSANAGTVNPNTGQLSSVPATASGLGEGLNNDYWNQ